MPQLQLPIFPKGSVAITPQLAFTNENEQITYTYGLLPVFSHAQNDHATFRMITAQFCANGNAKQADIVRAFGVTSISVKRAVKCYREKGPGGFYEKRKTRGAAVLTTSVLAEVQALLDAGTDLSKIAKTLGLKSNTLSKAIAAGRLHKLSKKKTEDIEPVVLTSKSLRTTIDSTTQMGMATTNTFARVAASIGALESAPLQFQAAADLPRGGVLLALPALLACGLLKHIPDFFRLPKGYYGINSLFLFLAFMALSRIKSVERLRYCAPGEWGKLLGLDRCLLQIRGDRH